MKTYKATDKDLKCRDFQFQLGKKYKHKGKIEVCESGFHSCENPIDIFSYYSPADSRFFEVEADGDILKHYDDSKIASSKITFKAELNLFQIIKIGVEKILQRVDFSSAATNIGDRSAATNTGYQSAATNTGYQSAATNTGDRSAATNTGYQSAATNTGYQSVATNTGYQSAATNTGYQSAATNTGYRSAATVSGKDSISCGLGYDNKVMGSLGCWIVCAERNLEGEILTVLTAKVDDIKIKSDVFYKVVKGKFVEDK